MVSIPCVKDGFLLSLRDRPCLVERGLGMVCFSGGMMVEGLEVNRPSGRAILFGTDDHAMTPCDWFSDWYMFEYPQSHISV